MIICAPDKFKIVGQKLEVVGGQKLEVVGGQKLEVVGGHQLVGAIK